MKEGKEKTEKPTNVGNTNEENENEVSSSEISRKRNVTEGDGVP